ncbi:rho GTPase-activating protein 24-like [Tachyglossus aculeatus]|uniref:rho GTPase-activating protein 24-like n=1 Tax=Tachyglossus aculeatus TaxID=9261 RepID=UPI0018F41595|nr:rho GTPase-activating protein 24-like [Tachyglossus aculeatus]
MSPTSSASRPGSSHEAALGKHSSLGSSKASVSEPRVGRSPLGTQGCLPASLSGLNFRSQGPPYPGPSLQPLLGSLRRRLSKQKAEYEAKIQSLEQHNQELQLEVSNLRSNLEQQRKWYSLVEIKMQNAERARKDAERRNQMLQREMEEFFDTFGELTNEVKKTERIVQSF